MPHNNILIVFPHGIGDLIMATPALRALRSQHSDVRIGLAVHSRTWNSGQAQLNPNIDEVFLVHNPWFSKTKSDGESRLKADVDLIADKMDFDDLRWVTHSAASRLSAHKVAATAAELSVDIENDDYDIFMTDDSKAEADRWLAEHGFDTGDYAFVHTHSSDRGKNIGKRQIIEKANRKFPNRVVAIDASTDITERPIDFWFELLRRSGYVGLVDSVFVHAADALGKAIDTHLTTTEIESVNRPLHAKRGEVVIRYPSRMTSYWHRLMSKLKIHEDDVFPRLFRSLKLRRPASISIEPGVEYLGDALGQTPGNKDMVLTVWGRSRDERYPVFKPFGVYIGRVDRRLRVTGVEPLDPIPTMGIDVGNSNGIDGHEVGALTQQISPISDSVFTVGSGYIFDRRLRELTQIDKKFLPKIVQLEASDYFTDDVNLKSIRVAFESWLV